MNIAESNAWVMHKEILELQHKIVLNLVLSKQILENIKYKKQRLCKIYKYQHTLNI